MPRVLIFCQVIANLIVNSIIKLIWADLLQETYVRESVPNRELQPGPPLSQRVSGSLLLAPLIDSTYM